MPFVTCPACGHEHQQSRDLVGLVGDCPKCGDSFRVTEEGAEGLDRPARRRKGWRWPPGRWLAVAGGAAVVLGLGVVGVLNPRPHPERPGPGEREMAGQVKMVASTADDWVNAADKNRKPAGQAIVVVEYRPGEDSYCFFPPGSLAAGSPLLKLDPGDWVVIVGKFDAKSPDSMNLSECRLTTHLKADQFRPRR